VVADVEARNANANVLSWSLKKGRSSKQHPCMLQTALVIKREHAVPAFRNEETKQWEVLKRRHVLPGTTFPRLESRRHMDERDGDNIMESEVRKIDHGDGRVE